jgi:hypothetical protein
VYLKASAEIKLPQKPFLFDGISESDIINDRKKSIFLKQYIIKRLFICDDEYGYALLRFFVPVVVRVFHACSSCLEQGPHSRKLTA